MSSGYRYDASLFPTVLVPILRLYYRMAISIRRGAASKPPRFGRASNLTLPIRPFQWQANGDRLIEFPVTTFPFLRIPIHMSYIHAISACSISLARRYFLLALALCKRYRVPLSFVLHPPDILDSRHMRDFAHFPGMSLSSQIKRRQLRWSLNLLNSQFDLIRLQDAAELLAGTPLELRRSESQSS
jgi:hypothetical protein